MSSSGVQRRYTPEEIDTALAIVAVYGGRTKLAAEKLAEAGDPIPQSTLQDWKEHHDGRYHRVCTTIAPQMADRIAAKAENIVMLISELEERGAELLLNNLHDLKPADIPAAIRNFSTTKALNMDKVINPIRGRPSTITEHRDANTLLESLASRLPPPIDSTATETTDPQEPETNQPQRVLSGQSRA